MPLPLQSGVPLTTSHSSGMLLPLQSGLVPLVMSHSSGIPFELQSGLVALATSHSSGTRLPLQSSLVPLAMFYLGEVLGARLLISTQNPWCGWMPVVLLTAVGAPLVWRQLRR